MKNNKDANLVDFEQFLDNSLKSHGFLFPETDEQMESFLATNNDTDLPDSLKDPMSIFSEKKHILNFSLPKIDTSEAEVNWALAARGGNQISDEVRDQMHKDRIEAERIKNGNF